jgi:hypothetical protein
MELQRRKMVELGMGIFGKHREWTIKGVKSWRVGTSKGSSKSLGVGTSKGSNTSKHFIKSNSNQVKVL